MKFRYIEGDGTAPILQLIPDGVADYELKIHPLIEAQRADKVIRIADLDLRVLHQLSGSRLKLHFDFDGKVYGGVSVLLVFNDARVIAEAARFVAAFPNLQIAELYERPAGEFTALDIHFVVGKESHT